MNSYSDLLESMMKALLTGDTAPAHTLYRDKKDFPPEEQLLVYLQGYHFRLNKVLRHLYTATHYYLGNDAFQMLANDYISSTPSRYFNIDTYALGFSDYIAHTIKDVFACELARLESALRELYQKPETPPLGKGWLEQQTPESLTNNVLQLRMASRLFAFNYPVSDYLSAFRGDEQPVQPAEAPTYLMVLRDAGQMQRVPLEEAEYVLLLLVAEGHTLGSAMASEDFLPYVKNDRLAKDFQHWFLHWVNENFFSMPAESQI